VRTNNEACDSSRRALYYEAGRAICPSVRRKSRRVDWWESRPVTKFSVSGAPPFPPPFFGAIIGPLTKQFPPERVGQRENGGRLWRDRDVNPMSPGTSLAEEDYARQILWGNTCTKLGARNSVLYIGRRPRYRDTLIHDTTTRNISGFCPYVFASATRCHTCIQDDPSSLNRVHLGNFYSVFSVFNLFIQFVHEKLLSSRFNHCTLV